MKRPGFTPRFSYDGIEKISLLVNAALRDTAIVLGDETPEGLAFSVFQATDTDDPTVTVRLWMTSPRASVSFTHPIMDLDADVVPRLVEGAVEALLATVVATDRDASNVVDDGVDRTVRLLPRGVS